MKLFRRQKKTEEVPAELQPYYDGNNKSQRQNLSKLWLPVVAVIAAGVLAWLVYSLVSGNSGTNPAPSSNSGQNQSKGQNAPRQGANNGGSSGSASNGSGSAKNSSGNQSNGGSSSASGGKSGQPQQIANTGPGDTVALFMGVVLLGALGSHAVQRHRVTTE